MARFPATPKPTSIAIIGTSPAYVMAAQSKRRKAVTQSAQYFEIELDFPPLTRDEYSPIHGFLAKQRGPVGQFEYVPHTHALPRGMGLAAAEEATSNLVKWSERLDLSPWGYSDAVNIVQGTSVTAPDGTPTGQLWLVNAANVDAWPRMRQQFTTGQITGTVSASLYLKAPAANAATSTSAGSAIRATAFSYASRVLHPSSAPCATTRNAFPVPQPDHGNRTSFVRKLGSLLSNTNKPAFHDPEDRLLNL
jgi:hypothetical protein